MRRKGVFDFAVEFVTDIVMGSDGSVDAKGLDDRDMSPATGWHFGFYSRPLDGAVGVVLRFFGMQFLIAYRDKQYELSLQKGEVGVQNAFSASTIWDKNGNIIETPSGSGTVQVGGNTYSLPQWDSFATALTSATAAIKGLTPATDLTSVILVANGIRTALVALDTAMSTNSNYKSTKAKNG